MERASRAESRRYLLEARQDVERTIQQLKSEGVAVIFVSHKLDEIMQATDEVTIMRQGAVVRHVETSDVDAGELAEAISPWASSEEVVALLPGTVDPETKPELATGRPAASGEQTAGFRSGSRRMLVAIGLAILLPLLIALQNSGAHLCVRGLHR